MREVASGLISIIIPTLDRPTLTMRAFESAKSQTYRHVEILIVDNGSGAQNIRLMKKLGLEFLEEPKSGAGAARKAGVAASRGEYILFLDSDDELMPDALQNLLQAIASGFELASGGLQNINSTEGEVRHDSEIHHTPMTSNSLLSRKAISKYGGFEDGNWSFMAWVLVAQDQGLIQTQVPELVCKRYIHGENLSITQDSYGFYFKTIRERLQK
jgi:glycosyltransferase involved in cell wall biosynthesis